MKKWCLFNTRISSAQEQALNSNQRYCRLTGSAASGIETVLVDIEISIVRGIPRNTIVGLPNGAVREALDRIRSALLASGYKLPRGAITVNLAPADVRKEGTSFDLPIALGILMAEGDINAGIATTETLVMGELSLDGSVRPVRGVLAALHGAVRAGVKKCIVPADNTAEAQVLTDLDIYGVSTLEEAMRAMEGKGTIAKDPKPFESAYERSVTEDFGDVIGQTRGIRAMEIVAAGGHNLLLIGPPGCGKTMLSRRLPTILPAWSKEEALETTCIHSLRGLGHSGLIGRRPFRAPHHSVSTAGMIGGGNPVLPGEVSLAHQGVLFLDELAEYTRSVLESLREPMEEGRVTISRAQGPVNYPACFQLVAAMNPCPCGYSGVKDRVCLCTPRQINQYRSKVSGPLMDRIDMQVMMDSVDPASSRLRGEYSSSKLSDRVARARAYIQRSRKSDRAQRLHPDVESMLDRAVYSLSMSMRSRKRVARVAHTIAALDEADTVSVAHIAEALRFRHSWH